MMNATTLQQAEGEPGEYPLTYPGIDLSEAAQALDPGMIWARLESYIVWRYSPRAVEWVVEGPGTWSPPLKPATIDTVEKWDGAAWQEVTLDPAPIGYCLADGTYRITAIVGEEDAEVPAVVVAAYQRLAEYMSAKVGKAGASSESVQAGSVTISHQRSASWMAKAIDNSGAADLLRQFRRA